MIAFIDRIEAAMRRAITWWQSRPMRASTALALLLLPWIVIAICRVAYVGYQKGVAPLLGIFTAALLVTGCASFFLWLARALSAPLTL